MKSGDTIFYPAHGVAKVVGVEEREFGGVRAEFYVLELNRGGRSMVPTRNVAQAGLRPLISGKKARDLIKSLKIEPILDNTRSWKDRASQYNEGLKTGAPESYTSILQELLYRARADKLSTTETKMLETARAYFVSELGEVLNMSVDRLEKELNDAITLLLPEAADLEEESDDDESDESDDKDGDTDEDAGEGGKKTKKTAKKNGKKKAKAAKKTGKKKAKTAKKTSKKKS